MARPNGWKYNNQTNCYVKPDYADYPSLPATTMKWSSNAKRQLKVKIKTEASTKKTIWLTHMIQGTTNKKATKRLIFTHSLLRLPFQNRTLALLNYTVQSPSKTPPAKKSRSGEHIVGCCICGPKYICSTKICSYLRKGLVCIACKSECCTNATKIVPTSSEIRDIVLPNFKEKKEKYFMQLSNP